MAAHTGFLSYVVNFNMAPLALIGFVSLVTLAYVFGTIIYNVYFHPLYRYPGHKLPAATKIPHALCSVSGQAHHKILELHQKFGPIVRVRKRLASKTERPDFMGSTLQKRSGSEELTFEELKSNAAILITAGSETTATALSATTYYLLTNPNALKKLSDEIRNTFASEADIDMSSSQKLAYMHAVINEGLRMYPPVPTRMPRKVNSDGGVFLGEYVPPDASQIINSTRDKHR
ncbi:cytochrome P450 [Colletotrichum navitas]|uniref:Cytochrome P450 n=1 Tax=Colletotrichum navitas TaxID=681940 RepID=A0AAD8V4M3_9PEZI|nr:cytochrome P450 [Colletotrichum navitas]KAK1586090.1 cytochrome P450 [Colletotrichum navitas]